jgi:LIM domain-binding protein 1
LWYDAFVNEFFDEQARFSIRNLVDDNGQTKNYTISRMLIARFFRSFSDGGVTDLYFQIARGQTQLVHRDLQSHTIVFETDSCIMNTKHGRPMFAKICTEGNLVIEFVQRFLPPPPPNQAQPPNQPTPLIPIEPLKIKNWIFNIKRHTELIPRSTIAIQQDPNLIDQLSKNITKMGITMQTYNYLKLCSILEPMQELMARHKATNMVPRECLRASVIQRNQTRMNNNTSNNNPQNMQFQRSNSNSVLIDELNSPIKSEKLNSNSNNNSQNQSPAQSPAPTPGKRRKRKSSNGSLTPGTPEVKKESVSKSKKAQAAAAAAAAAATQQQQQMQQFNFNSPSTFHNQMMQHPHHVGQHNDVMTVGEPSLMGGDFGEEDERVITRLENNQFDFNSNSSNLINMPPTLKQPSPTSDQSTPSRTPSSLISPARPQSTTSSSANFLMDNNSLVNSKRKNTYSTASTSTTNNQPSNI